ncbi:hypothetical protein BGW38_005072, partial [Lunasporangiospora selenospora]
AAQPKQAQPKDNTKKKASAKKNTPTPKKVASKQKPVEEEEEESEDDKEESEEEEEVAFKIHTSKAPSAPAIIPAKLETYEDEESEEEDDEAPEAESLSSAKAKVLSAQDKEKAFLVKVQAEQKAKRVEKEQKIKADKEKSKKSIKSKKQAEESEESEESEDDEEEDKDAEVKESAGGSRLLSKKHLPELLPANLLEAAAKMDEDRKQTQEKAGASKKHLRPEDFAMMELEIELKVEAAKRRKLEKTERNVGPVTVKALNNSATSRGQAIPQTVVDFRQQHFYGKKIQRRDAVLNMSKRGTAIQFHRKK